MCVIKSQYGNNRKALWLFQKYCCGVSRNSVDSLLATGGCDDVALPVALYRQVAQTAVRRSLTLHTLRASSGHAGLQTEGLSITQQYIDC